MTAPSRTGEGRAPKICFPFIGDDLGGSHISAIKLVAGLLHDGFEASVVLQQDDGPLADYLTCQGVDFQLLRSTAGRGRSAPGALLELVGALPRIVSFLRRNRFDIVHTNDGRTHLIWGIAARIAGARLVWHHRGDPSARATNLVAPLVAHRLLAVSRFALPDRPLLPIGKRSRVVHSPFEHPAAIDRSAAHAMLASELGVHPQADILGYFGGLIDRKRPLLFVDIVHRLLQAAPERQVIGCLFGLSAPGGPDLAAACLERADALGISGSISLMGFCQPVEPYMAGCDILLIPAVGEPFGRTLIEAMMLGTPVIATAHGGNLEAIEDDVNGILVAPESASAFIAPIISLLTDEARRERIAASARNMALQRFSAAQHVGSVEAIYREILPPADIRIGRAGTLGLTH